jgi:hypothetical protein
MAINRGPAESALLFFPIFFATVALFLLTQPVVAALLVALWALPLASALFQESVESSTVGSWVHLDRDAMWPNLMRWEGAPYRIRFALGAGLAGGTIYGLALLGIRLYRRLAIPPEIADSDAGKLTFAFGAVVLAVAIQVIVASFVASRVRHLAFVHGLFAAFIAGGLSFAGFIGLNLVFGGTADAAFLWNMFRVIVNGGTMWAIPFAGIVVLTAGWLRGRQRARLPSSTG